MVVLVTEVRTEKFKMCVIWDLKITSYNLDFFLKKILNHMKELVENRLICNAVSKHVTHVMIPKTVSNDSQKVPTMCEVDSFLKFCNLRILCHK